MDLPKVRSDEVSRHSSGMFNENTAGRHYANEVQFSFHNHREIVNAFEEGRAVDLADLPKQKEKSVMIIGSGPTLDKALPFLKDWKGEIICSASQAATLIAWGRDPEHIVALDPDSSLAELRVDTWEGRNSILHLHPGVMPDLVRGWKGKLAFFRKLQPQNTFYGIEQQTGYSPLGPFREGRYWGNESKPYIRSQVPMLACVLAAQICIAKQLGYRQQILVGTDFASIGDQLRFTSRSWDGSAWIEHKPVSLEGYSSQLGAENDPMIEIEIDGLKSSATKIFYAHQTVIAWRLTECDIINAFPEGFLRMFPSRPFEEIMRRGNKGVKGYNLKQIRAASEEHLAKQNIFFFNVGDGIMPHEFKDPLHDIPKALADVKKILEAQGRGDQLDINANMKRLQNLFTKVLHAT